MTTNTDEKDRTLFCGNISERVTEDILYELFLQGGPLERAKIALDNMKRRRGYAFITFKHAASVPYTLELMNGIHLYGKPLKLQYRQGSIHEQNNHHQQHMNRSMSAPNMGNPYQSDQGGLAPHLQRNQTTTGFHNSGYGGGGGGSRSSRDASSDRGNRDRNRSDNNSRGRSGGYNTPPIQHDKQRQSRFDISPGVLPLMNPSAPLSIEQQRLNVMAAQQQIQQMNFLRQQQQQQRGNQGRMQPWQQQGYRGQR